jgi:hypothetical protein
VWDTFEKRLVWSQVGTAERVSLRFSFRKSHTGTYPILMYHKTARPPLALSSILVLEESYLQAVCLLQEARLSVICSPTQWKHNSVSPSTCRTMSIVSSREVAKVLRKMFTTTEKVFLTKDRPFYTHQPTNVHQSQRRRAFSTAFRQVHDSSSSHKRGFCKKEPASEWSRLVIKSVSQWSVKVYLLTDWLTYLRCSNWLTDNKSIKPINRW